MKANAMILMLDSSDEDDLEVYEALLQFERNKVTIKAADSVEPDFLFYGYKNGLDCFHLDPMEYTYRGKYFKIQGGTYQGDGQGNYESTTIESELTPTRGDSYLRNYTVWISKLI